MTKGLPDIFLAYGQQQKTGKYILQHRPPASNKMVATKVQNFANYFSWLHYSKARNPKTAMRGTMSQAMHLLARISMCF